MFFPKKNDLFFIPGPLGKLEIMTTWPSVLSKPMVGIVCHPHPLYQGTMQNKVVAIIATAFNHLGLPSVRFNFRGVGESEGVYGDGVGEIEDLKSVIAWVNKVLPDNTICLAGFSFGAYIATSVAAEMTLDYLISVALPVGGDYFSSIDVGQIQCPWLMIQGDKDEIVSVESVKAWVKNNASQAKFIMMHNTSHFFHGQLVALRKLLELNLKEHL